MAGICDTCHAGCCRTFHLAITAYDALVIARDLGLPVGEFTTFFTVKAKNSERIWGNNTLIRFSDPHLVESHFLIGLKKVESALIAGTSKCFFLQEWNRQDPVAARGDHPGARVAGRCGIYQSRPQMCRTFPATLGEEGALGYISTPTPTDLSSQHEIYRTCPEKWTPEAFGEEPTKVLHSLILTRYEIDFQNRAVAEWNHHPGLAKDFFPFMFAAYGFRLRLQPEAVENPPEIRNAEGTVIALPPAPIGEPPAPVL